MSTVNLTPIVDVRRAEDRYKSQFGWLDSKHSFSFGHHFNRANTHHGLLLVNNDDVVDPGTGFDTHPHQDMEIVTWVLEGSLVHQDSTGHNGVIYPGLAQRMSAGRGILHSEKNDSWKLAGDVHKDPVHFVQMWVVPDENNITPGYEQLEIDHELLSGGLVPVASGMDKHNGASAIRINNKYAALHAARLQPGQSIELPEAPFLHLFVPRGSVSLEGAGALGTAEGREVTRARLPLSGATTEARRRRHGLRSGDDGSCGRKSQPASRVRVCSMAPTALRMPRWLACIAVRNVAGSERRRRL